MSVLRRLREIVSDARRVGLPPPVKKEGLAGTPTDEVALYRSWIRAADRNPPPREPGPER